MDRALLNKQKIGATISFSESLEDTRILIQYLYIHFFLKLKAAMITTSSTIQKGVPLLVGMKIGLGIVTT